MNKEVLLEELSAKISNGEISKQEVIDSLHLKSDNSETEAPEKKEEHHFPVNTMLYSLGGVIVVVGVSIFISQIWGDIESFGRILVTLGLGLLATGSGTVLLKKKPEDAIGLVFQGIGGALIPGGALVTLHELSTGQDTLWPVVIVFAVITVFYGLLNFAHKNALLTFFAIANGTAFLYTLIEAIIDGPFYQHDDIIAYLTMVIGVSYMALAYAFRIGWNKALSNALYLFGIVFFLAAAYSRVFDSVFWQMAYFFILGGAFYLSIYIKRRVILVMSTLFLVAHVSYITSKYFAESIGWPISLIVLGFMFIGLGFATVAINKKYIAEQSEK